MEFAALHALPWTLLILSLAVACFNRWQDFPALGVLAAVNVLRSILYVVELYAWNPALSNVSAVLMLLVSEESLRRAGLRPWPCVFCASIGLMLGAMAVEIGEASSPLKSATHIATGAALAIGLFVSLVKIAPVAAIGRLSLMLLYAIGAAANSKQHRPDEWWSILTTESIHVAALSGFLLLAVASGVRRASVPPVD